MPAPTSEIDALFQLPLDEFTAARNALAAKLKKAGRDEEAAQVQGLAKPPIPAWVVNQLYWRHRKALDALLDAGERFRKAQASQLAGKSADMQAPLEARREALSDLATHATALMRASGHPPTPDAQRRITTTLDALATYGRQIDAPRAGRLTDEVQPPGFEALAGLTGSKGSKGATSRVIPFHQPSRAREKKTDKEERAAAKKATAEAERTLADARKSAVRAQAALKKAAATAKQADRAKAALEGQFEKATAEADAARQNARRVASEAEEAAQAVEDAERTLDQARRTLESLKD
jgi:hypothetical protein